MSLTPLSAIGSETMKTLVERLRDWDSYADFVQIKADCAKAADEIERLVNQVQLKNDALQEKWHEVTRLRSALLLSPCPRPIGDGETVADCLKSGNCGCCNSAALEGKT